MNKELDKNFINSKLVNKILTYFVFITIRKQS